MKSYTEHLAFFEAALTQTPFEGQPTNLYEPIRYTLDLGGKRIRPVLTLMACEMFDSDVSKALPAALCIEVFHNFTLIHDDIMDQAPLRRGKETVYKKWDIPIAILSGDLMMIRALQLLHKAPKEVYSKLFDHFTQTAIQVCEGQQLDMNFETTEKVSQEQYLEMILLKTSVLLAASLYCGAISGGASEADANLLYEFGLNTGLAFQIQDDILDAFGDAQTGKQVGGDIAANKKTLLYIELAECCHSDDLKWFNELKNNSNINERINGVLSLYKKYQIREFAEMKMETFMQKAMSAMNQVSLNDDKKMGLAKVAMDLMLRQK